MGGNALKVRGNTLRSKKIFEKKMKKKLHFRGIILCRALEGHGVIILRVFLSILH